MELPSYYRKEFESTLGHLYDPLVKITAFGREKKLRAIITKAIPRKSKKILDMATGTGSVAIEIKKTLPKAQVFGIDLSRTMLSKAKEKSQKQKLNIKFLRKNIEKTDLNSNYFDTATISLSLHEIPWKNRLIVFKEAYRILKKGGTFIIMEFAKSSNKLSRLLQKTHFKIFEPKHAYTIFDENLVQELQDHGFNNVKKKQYFTSLIQVVIGTK